MVFGKVYENRLIIKKIFYFTKLTLKRVILIRNLLFSPKNLIITKLGQKRWTSLVSEKVYERCLKIKEKCYFMKFTSKRVISTRNPLFGPKRR